jgi:peptidoglycan/xylan/chitin deacetylase (PgdA/CDA1 family)
VYVRVHADSKVGHDEYTPCEYRPLTAIWRILRILDEEGLKATINTCGGIAKRFPEAVKAIVQRGHETAGHGNHHEVARNLTLEEEDLVMRWTIAMIKERTGQRAIG